MKLNKLETVFFDEIINAELDVPVHATLKYEGTTFEIIVEPEIAPEGYLRFKYYNAPPYEPEPQVGPDGAIFKELKGIEIFGTHPLLEEAWQKRALVELQLNPSQSPLQPKSNPSLNAKVLYADVGHRGELVLDQNQVIRSTAPLIKAEFTISGFSDFRTPEKQWLSTAGFSETEYEALQSVANKLGDDAELTVTPARHNIALNTGDGWQITLTKDENSDSDVVSHVGSVQKINGDDFTIGELCDVLEGLRYFFAFTIGNYCFPTVIVGYDESRRATWAQVGRFEAGRQHTLNWFHHPGDAKWGRILEQFFPKFWTKWTAHKDEIIAVIDCYVRSTVMRRAGLQQDAVAKSCFGLEILASLVLEKTIQYPDVTAEEIDKVLRCYRILNRQVGPSNAPVSDQLYKNLNLTGDLGANLIVTIRNYVAHPLHKQRTEIRPQYLRYLDSDVLQYTYLHDLSQFYVEYTLLRFCGYNVAHCRQLRENQG